MSQPSSTLTIRADIAATIGNFGRVMAAIGDAGAEVGGADIVRSTATVVTRDITVAVQDADHGNKVVAALSALDGVSVVHAMDRVTLAHVGGKLTMRNRADLTSRDDLSMAYTPGVARVCMAIHHDPERTWDLTIRGNSIAVVSDGTAVAGQGALGALAALPSAEAKCVYMRERAGVDGFPLPLDVKTTDQTIDVVSKITSVFGGVHLTDMEDARATPVAAALGEALDVPVLHEEGDALAVVVVAAVLNGLQVTGTALADATVATAGDDPVVGTAARLLTAAGVGTTDAGDGADAFVGAAGAPTTPAPIVCSLDEAVDTAAAGAVLATPRADLPNHIDAALAYPGIWRGALDCRARTINDEMLLAAARAIASSCGAVSADNVLPSVLNANVAANVAAAVREAAVASGAARLTPTPA